MTGPVCPSCGQPIPPSKRFSPRAAAEVLQALEQLGGWRTVVEIEERAGWTWTTTRQVLRALARAGVIQRARRGCPHVYALLTEPEAAPAPVTPLATSVEAEITKAPRTIRELIVLTGRDKSSVRDALRRLGATSTKGRNAAGQPVRLWRLDGEADAELQRTSDAQLAGALASNPRRRWLIPELAAAADMAPSTTSKALVRAFNAGKLKRERVSHGKSHPYRWSLA